MNKGTFHKKLDRHIYSLFKDYKEHGYMYSIEAFTQRVMQDLKKVYDQNIAYYNDRIETEDHHSIRNSSVIEEVRILNERLELIAEMQKCIQDGNCIEI